MDDPNGVGGGSASERPRPTPHDSGQPENAAQQPANVHKAADEFARTDNSRTLLVYDLPTNVTNSALLAKAKTAASSDSVSVAALKTCRRLVFTNQQERDKARAHLEKTKIDGNVDMRLYVPVGEGQRARSTYPPRTPEDAAKRGFEAFCFLPVLDILIAFALSTKVEDIKDPAIILALCKEALATTTLPPHDLFFLGQDVFKGFARLAFETKEERDSVLDKPYRISGTCKIITPRPPKDIGCTARGSAGDRPNPNIPSKSRSSEKSGDFGDSPPRNITDRNHPPLPTRGWGTPQQDLDRQRRELEEQRASLEKQKHELEERRASLEEEQEEWNVQRAEEQEEMEKHAYAILLIKFAVGQAVVDMWRNLQDMRNQQSPPDLVVGLMDGGHFAIKSLVKALRCSDVKTYFRFDDSQYRQLLDEDELDDEDEDELDDEDVDELGDEDVEETSQQEKDQADQQGNDNKEEEDKENEQGEELGVDRAGGQPEGQRDGQEKEGEDKEKEVEQAVPANATPSELKVPEQTSLQAFNQVIAAAKPEQKKTTKKKKPKSKGGGN